jgi:hypothetical protein
MSYLQEENTPWLQDLRLGLQDVHPLSRTKAVGDIGFGDLLISMTAIKRANSILLTINGETIALKKRR